MTTVHKFGRARLLDPNNEELTGQQRVNAEIFTAMELLARKLEQSFEQSQTERETFARRLALIESSATVDEETGKLYLPAMQEKAMPAAQPKYAPQRWMIASSLASSAIALSSLGLVLFRAPAPATLSPEHLAILESLHKSQFATISPDQNKWKTPAVDYSTNGDVARNEHQEPILQVMEDEDATSSPEQVAAEPPAAELPEAPKTETAEATPVTVEQKPVEQAAAEQAPLPPAAPVAEITAKPPEAPQMAEAQPSPQPEPVAKKPAAPVVAAKPAPETLPVDANMPASLSSLEQRAINGVPEAQHDLATIYASGKMVAQNYPRAIYWFKKSADGGVANAHYNLGVIYHQGLGVTADMKKALGWYEKAAELGHPEAMYNLGIAYIEGIGAKPDIERGVAYFKRAAKAGVAQASYNLGVLYESNFIGTADPAKALEWYQLAASEGHADAKAAIARLGNATPVQQAAQSPEQSLTPAEMVEPAAGEEYGEGDASSASEEARQPTEKEILSSIQKELMRLGLLPGPADGLMTQQTEDALKSYQRRLGVVDDGIPTVMLLEKIQQDARSR